jgi:predicted nucleic acid-binding protein
MTAGSLKVVFDTNILVSGHFWKGPPYRCVLAMEPGLATLVCASTIRESGSN